MSETNEELKKAHPMSLKGIFNKYTVSKIIFSRGTFISLIVTAAIVLYFCIHFHTVDDYYQVLYAITDTVLSLLPNILGFCIGGYALIIGAFSMDTIKKMSKPFSKKHNLSMYQVLSSVFAATLIIQCMTLVLVCLIRFGLLLDLKTDCGIWCAVVNVSLIAILIFFSCISLSLLYYTIVNLFTLGQTMHFCIRNEDNEQIKQMK